MSLALLGTVPLNERWIVEILEAGLWIREIDRTDGAALVRQLPLDAEHCTLVVGVAESQQTPPPWRAIERLVSRLPRQAQERIRVAVPAAAGEWLASAAVHGCRRIMRGGPLAVITPGGQLVAWAPPFVEQPDSGTSTGGSRQTVRSPDRRAPWAAGPCALAKRTR